MSQPSTVQPDILLAANAQSQAGWVPLITFTGWSGLLLVGLLGLLLPYQRPLPPAKEAVLPPIEMVDVELVPEAKREVPLPAVVPELASAEPPPLLEPIHPPEAPPLVAVAELTEAVAFALPVEGPARIVDLSEASYRRAASPAAPAVAPPIETLVLGEGEGFQPKPEYPRKALREGQEGTVVVVFSVGEDGRVRSAELSSSSSWELLDEAALRVIRERYRFSRGPERRLKVSIRFEQSK